MPPVEPHELLLVHLRVHRALALVVVHHVLTVLQPPPAQVRKHNPPRTAHQDEVLKSLWPVRGDLLVTPQDYPSKSKSLLMRRCRLRLCNSW